MANFTVRPSTTFSVRTAPGGVISGGGGSTTTQSSAPSAPSQGNIWYDTTTKMLKVYDGTYWDNLGMGSDYDNDNKFEWKPDATLSSGMLATFSNNTGGSLFSITYDGVIALKVFASPPSSVVGGIYHDGRDVWIESN
jgi:hypothetical protein